MNTTVGEDTDGCDATVTKLVPPPATPETPEPPKPSEPAKPEQPKTIEKATAETGETGYAGVGLNPAVAGGIGILGLAAAGGITVAVRRRKNDAE